MIGEIITNIIAGLIVTVMLLIIGIILKRHLWNRAKKKITSSLTDNSIAAVYSYDIALKKKEKTLAEPKPVSELKVMCFMGKDLSIERGLLDEIKTFLNNGGRAKFLVIDPQSEYVTERAKELNKDENTLRMSIQNTIVNINEEFKRWHPTHVEVKLYNQLLPIFRMDFIGNVLFLGFYTNIKSYNHIFYEIPSNSLLYNVLEKLFKRTWEDSKNA